MKYHSKLNFCITTVVLLMLGFAPTTVIDAADDPNVTSSVVHIPWMEFKAIIDSLKARSHTQENRSRFSSQEYALSAIIVKGTIAENKVAWLQATATLTVMPSKRLKTTGYIPVHLGSFANRGVSQQQGQTAILESVLCNGNQVPVLNTDSASYCLLSASGVQRLQLNYSCPVFAVNGEYRMQLQTPCAPARLLELTIPGSNIEVSVNGIKQAPTREQNKTRVSCALDGMDNLSIVYTSTALRDTAQTKNAGSVKPKVFAQTGMLISVKDNRIVYTFQISYQVWNKKVTRFVCALSDSLTVEQVSGVGIKEWNMVPGEHGPNLEVTTNFTVQKEYSLTFTLSKELPAATAAVPVPSFFVQDVDRQQGYYAVEVSQGLEVTLHDSTRGLVAVDAQELPQWLQEWNRAVLKLKYREPAHRLVLSIFRHTELPVMVAIADEVKFRALFTRSGYGLAHYVYRIRNNHKQYLQVTMPKQWHLWSVLIDGSAVMPATGAGSSTSGSSVHDSSVLLIPMKKISRTSVQDSYFTMELVYWNESKEMNNAGTLRFCLPLIDITVQTIAGTLWIPEQYTYAQYRGTLKAAQHQSGHRYAANGFDDIEGFRGGGTVASSITSGSFKALANQQFAVKKAAAVGFPVEVDVPRSGVAVTFSQQLTTAGEKAETSFRYHKKTEFFRDGAGWALTLLVLLCGWITFWLPLKQAKNKKMMLSAAFCVSAYFFLVILNTVLGIEVKSLLFKYVFAFLVTALFYGNRKSRESSAKAVHLLMVLGMVCTGGGGGCRVVETYAGESPALEGSYVTMPWRDFKNVLNQLTADSTDDTSGLSLPVDYTITSSQIDGRQVSEQQCLFSGSLTITVLKGNTWLKIPFGKQTALFPPILLNGAPATVGKDRSSTENYVLLKGGGTSTLTYRFSAPIDADAAMKTVRFALPPQATTIIRFALDNNSFEVTANGRSMIRKSTDGKQSVYEAGIQARPEASLTWQQEMSRMSVENTAVNGSTNLLYSIGMGTIQISSATTLSIMHKSLNSFSVTLPATVEIVTVGGPLVSSWEGADSAGVRTVKIYFRENCTGQTEFSLQAEMSYADGAKEITLPGMNLVGTTAQEGFIGVRVVSTIELATLAYSPNVVAKDKRELPGWFGAGDDLLYAYHYFSTGYKIPLSVVYHRNRSTLAAIVTHSSLRSVIRDDGKMMTQWQFSVRNRGEQFLHIAAWNPDNQIWSLFCNDAPAKPSFDTAAKQLLIPLEKYSDRSAVTSIRLVYLSRQKPFSGIGKYRIEYPAVGLPTQNCSGTLYLPKSLLASRFTGSLTVAETSQKPIVDFLFLPLLGRRYSLDAVHGYGYGGSAMAHKEMKPQSEPALTEPAAPSPTKKIDEEIGRLEDELKSMGNSPVPLKKKQGLLREGSGAKGGKMYFYDDKTPFGNADQQMAKPQSQQIGETGNLSLAVDIAFEGMPHSFSSPLFKSFDTQDIAFHFRKTFEKKPAVLVVISYLLLIIAALILTWVLSGGRLSRLAIWSCIGSCVLSLLLSWLIGMTLYLDALIMIPFLFLLFQNGRLLGPRLGRLQKKFISKMRRKPSTKQSCNSEGEELRNP
ncbi:MAG: hypothetical protein JW795_20990 [Chitinivibrionales bacterium]|nr:hypothetical protein [Chitinivibrionales bacterium]